MFLWNYDITTGAGVGSRLMMEALYGEKICSYRNEQGPNPNNNYKSKLLNSWNQSFQKFCTEDSELQNHISSSSIRWGILLATTKGHLEDYIWQLAKPTSTSTSIDNPDQKLDFNFNICPEEPGSVLLNEFIKKNWIKNLSQPTLSASISQACSSTHIAFEVAQNWLDWNLVDFVLILAGDLIGPFVSRGFASLKLLAHESQRPFDRRRDGLFLGDAVGCSLVSHFRPSRESIKIHALSNHTEGAITKPSFNGDSLFYSLKKLQNSSRIPHPDFVVAHGTGTRFNDTAEDFGLAKYFYEYGLKQVPITGAKWSLGHTLGCSGLVDLIAASEVLKKQKLFSIATAEENDPHFKLNSYILKNSNIEKSIQGSSSELKEAIINSLGFGGVHASCWIERVTT
jgi:hypothetical protein